jgi:hypothetical protein
MRRLAGSPTTHGSNKKNLVRSGVTNGFPTTTKKRGTQTLVPGNTQKWLLWVENQGMRTYWPPYDGKMVRQTGITPGPSPRTSSLYCQYNVNLCHYPFVLDSDPISESPTDSIPWLPNTAATRNGQHPSWGTSSHTSVHYWVPSLFRVSNFQTKATE